jgi:ribosomal protein L7/L12
MNPNRPLLSAEAINAIERGDLVEAIKLTREHTGLGLKEAKELVESQGRKAALLCGSKASSSTMPMQAVVALQKGKLIDAIKAFREQNGQGLKDSKVAVERYLDEHPLTKRQFDESASLERRRLLRIVVMVALFACLALSFLLARSE